ncbi:MAG: hypothetical protein SWQ30_04715 [Thermodesulfobacteriota bacterium]|nr:hypothetical protein [Thermodesulfobacteriota bacterium]
MSLEVIEINEERPKSGWPASVGMATALTFFIIDDFVGSRDAGENRGTGQVPGGLSAVSL